MVKMVGCGKDVCVKYGRKYLLENIYNTFFVFLMRIFVNCNCLACIVVILCVLVALCVYCSSYFRCRTAG